MKLDRVAPEAIRMHLSESMYYTVQSCTTAKELWKTLSDTYEKKVAATKIYLIRRLYNLRMKESDSIMAHLIEYEGVISQLPAEGMTIDDEQKAGKSSSRLYATHRLPLQQRGHLVTQNFCRNYVAKQQNYNPSLPASQSDAFEILRSFYTGKCRRCTMPIDNHHS
jgi:hypothetical protein